MVGGDVKLTIPEDLQLHNVDLLNVYITAVDSRGMNISRYKIL